MAEKSTTKSRKCKQCECEIQFGMYCEDCVSSERVCQMCGVDISHRDESAMTCNDNHKKTRQRRINAMKPKSEGTSPLVPAVSDDMIIVPKKDWNRLMEIVTNLALNVDGIASPKGMGTPQNVPFPKPMDLGTDELPVVEVKKSKAQGGSSQNFLNSIMALNG